MNNDNRSAVLAAELRSRIDSATPGTKLPGVRELSREFRASAATVSAALAELGALGLVRAEPGRGTFVAERAHRRDPDFAWQSQTLGRTRVDPDRASRLGGHGSPEQIPLSWGYLSAELLPAEGLQRIGARAARGSRAWQLTPPAGSPELRRVIAADYRADPGDVLIVPGGQQGLVFAMRTLAEPGSAVITESPSYPGAILAAQSAGLALAAVPADADGILVDRLAVELERTRARVVYLQPSFANPTGAVLSAERRARVLELAAQHGAFVIEDDWARHLGLERSTPPPLFSDDPHGHVVTVTTLAKPASPGLRIGAVIARGPAGQRIRASRTADDLGVAPLLQEIATDLLTSPAWPRHLKRLRAELTVRRDALVSAVRSALPDARIARIPDGGLHLWVRLAAGVDSRDLAERAGAAGVLVGDGRHFFVDEPPAPFVRLSYGAATPAQIAEGVRRVGSLLAR
ncbi:GntR family transcriptional regulator [Leucobacter sp. OLJS4]|uniref:aminotransferase-like domain-containing protein n=1 Tax=unclassified Leucobacter TaxID=2621730 RepID=UPI000C19A010|nr:MULTISPECIES: PLP-dependent aminotransferase family protein [unclassified Leucobacter]PII81413.1 GntR family transcriptional regulator [Leucobacter sp. OLCALW19]PII86082.1 GntR family transcriptional regulator [Leucobacter sp. OLTLW20]PII89978.1 GntR family transcriptional regulator [Leucobacter sp. OLAS13]PII97009.1 GntR family transcriptional regulator [Leucobacter sp. OLDS2]PIJ02295.1 GntR family transcriptional regulator [Leucobacter sp. OLIS6]